MTVTVITGASRGIGAATARHLATTGTHQTLILSYLSNQAAAQKVADEAAKAGAVVEIVQADVAVEADVLKLFAAADSYGQLTGLVNNAGIVAPLAPLNEFSAERIERIMAVNVVGAFLCAREAARRMGDGGSIVNVSSRAATLGSPNEFVDYAASKGAVDTMTKGLAIELGPAGVRVNAVRPGLIETDIHDVDPSRLDRLLPNVPLGRLGGPDEIAALIAWLLSAESSYVSGALIDCGGGR